VNYLGPNEFEKNYLVINTPFLKLYSYETITWDA